ncbi:MAG: homoserine kinase [Bacillota bacterium]|nr:homoserine kinase [Bacillota bacterium]
MIRVLVPATSANLGSGFDSLGLALKLYNVIEAEVTEGGITIEQTGVYTKSFPPEKNLVYQAMESVFNLCGNNPKGLSIKINTSIPGTRGLGSSAACIIGGMVAANALIGKLGSGEILKLACKMEGHPDNVVPCLTGGFITAYYDGENLTYNKLYIKDDIALAVFFPEGTISTKKSRTALPPIVSHQDAAFSAAHSALFTSAIVSGRYDILKEAVKDVLHQPYRFDKIDKIEDIFSFCYNAGAYACYLSGSGPSIGVIIKKSMKNSFRQAALNFIEKNAPLYEFDIYDFDNRGAMVTKF